MADQLKCGTCCAEFAIEDFATFVRHKQECLTGEISYLGCAHCPADGLDATALIRHIQSEHGIQLARPSHVINCPLRDSCCIEDGSDIPCEAITYCPRIFGSSDEALASSYETYYQTSQADPCEVTSTLEPVDGKDTVPSLELGKPQFTCLICKRIFKQKVHLKKHEIMKHGGEKPFKCSECEYSAVDKSHLKIHMRKHTGYKPYICHSCDFRAAQNSTLRQHCAIKHPNLMIPCEDCKKQFFTTYDFNRHRSVCSCVDSTQSLKSLS